MIYDYAIAQKAHCSEKEKKELKPLIRRIFDYAVISRREGLLAVEDSLKNEKSGLLCQGLELVIDGTDPEIVSNILKNNIYMSDKKGSTLLEKIIIHSGVCGIQKGYSPLILLQILAAFIGNSESEIIEETTGEYKAKTINSFLSHTPELSGVPMLDTILPKLHGRFIQKMLREVDTNELSKSLFGASTETKRIVFKNMSPRAAFLVAEDCSYLSPIKKEDVEQAQTKLKNILKKLEKSGEIVLPAGMKL